MSALILHQKDGRSSFQFSLPLSSSVLTPVKSLSHQVRQIAFQRLLPAAKRESRAGQAAAGSWGRQQVPNTCGSLEFPSPGAGQPAVGRGLLSALALDGAGGTLPCTGVRAGASRIDACEVLLGHLGQKVLPVPGHLGLQENEKLLVA